MLRVGLILLQLPTALMVLYLDLLSVAALRWRHTPAPAATRQRFAVLIPAHDEELLLPRLLESLARLDYPNDRYDVHVVADNCTDSTASVASRRDARVHERHDEQAQGKGYALQWLLSRLKDELTSTPYDAYIIVDADTIVSPNFLSVMNDHLARGDAAIQCYYGVLNSGDSWPSALRYAALALYNGLRPRGRDTLGLSAGLRGNGMCFASSVVERFGWGAFTLAEDAEFHLRLVEAGIRVAYAPDATVLAEMPTSLRQARSQNVRWERGRLQMLHRFGPRLLHDGIARRDPVRLDAMAEQLIPPLSVLTGTVTAMCALTTILRAHGARRLAVVVLLGQIMYVLTGLFLAKANLRVYLALMFTPLYVVWKLWVYVAAAMHLRDERWVRTARR